MREHPVAPHQCSNMAEVRRGVDWLDEQIVALIAQRFRYMDAAARIKTERGTVRDEARKAEVIANARAHADAAGIPAPVVEDVYERLVEGSIAYEYERYDALRASGSAD